MLSLGISTFFQLLSIVAYGIYFPKLSIVKYYRSKAALEGAETVSADLAAAGIQNNVRQINMSLLYRKYGPDTLITE